MVALVQIRLRLQLKWTQHVARHRIITLRPQQHRLMMPDKLLDAADEEVANSAERISGFPSGGLRVTLATNYWMLRETSSVHSWK